MIKDRRPYFIRNLIENFYKFWTYYFIKPQFKSVGKNLDINKPWNLDIYGNNIIKLIRENDLIKSIPNSYTIQFILDYLTPIFIKDRNTTKYFFSFKFFF